MVSRRQHEPHDQARVARPRVWARLAAAWMGLRAVALVCVAQGIPEPGLVLYGSITNSAGSVPLALGRVVWSVSGGGSSTVVTSSIVAINQQFFYITTLPFETRSISGQPAFPATPNTLELKTTATSYTRTVTVEGTNAIISFSGSGTGGSFLMGPADRGARERVDLAVNLGPETYDQWAARLGFPGLPPNGDLDQDGLSNYGEYKAGTDPGSAGSSFKFLGIRPGVSSGLVLNWSSVAGGRYVLERATNLSGPYSLVQSNLLATPPTNSFVDPAPLTAPRTFYRLRVQ
jgi:hypothetical protein